jgi:serralysin
MAENSSSVPGTNDDQTIVGTSGNDSLTGGYGSDTITSGTGDDIISGDGALPGTWLYSLYTRDFTANAGQAFDIESGTLLDQGFVTDFDVQTLAQTSNGNTANPNDFGVIYQNTLSVDTGGTYRFDTTSDDGSTIQIFDGSGNALTWENQNGSTGTFLNNDFHQGATTRWGEVELDSNESYTIELRYWENGGGNVLDATVSGPDTGGIAQPLIDSSIIDLPPEPEEVIAPNPYDTGDWAFQIYDNNFVNAPDQAFDIENGTLIGQGYVSDLDTESLAQAARQSSAEPSDYGIIYTSTLTITDGGIYDFSTRSDDGSTLQLFDSSGNAVQWNNSDGTTGNFLDNDYHQGATTRTGQTTLQAGETYTIQVRYWENTGQEFLEVEMNGADTGDTWQDVQTVSGFGNPPIVEVTIDNSDNVVQGGDILDAGAGSDTITTGGGKDFIVSSSFGGGATTTDTITDFDTVLDVADLSPFFATVEDLQNATTMVNGNAVVTLPDGAKVVFEGVSTPSLLTANNTLVPCFTPGTLIQTPFGLRRVETMAIDDLVVTRDNGLQPIRWVGSRHLSASELRAAPNLAPVILRKDALGPGLPTKDLMVSPQHRLLLEGYRIELAIGQSEAFCAAKTLIDGTSVVTSPLWGVTYIHLMFDAHQILTANGMPCESLLPSAPVLDAFHDQSREELLAIYPDLRAAPTHGPFQMARPSMSAPETRFARFG